MNENEFIDWIKELGFSKTWETYDGEYSIKPGGDGIFDPKIYFTTSYEESEIKIGIHYAKMNGTMSYGSNIGYFNISQIGEFEKIIIVHKLIEYFDEVPIGFKKYLRDSKIKDILGY